MKNLLLKKWVLIVAFLFVFINGTLATSNYLVSGSLIFNNVTFVQDGIQNGRPSYFLDETWADYRIYWSGTKWLIVGHNFGIAGTGGEPSNYYYYNNTDQNTPPLNGWQVDINGSSPAPSLTENVIVTTNITKYEVSGASNGMVNGIYSQAGTSNGKPYYTTSNVKLWWSGSVWCLDDINTNQPLYWNNSTNNTPPETGWSCSGMEWWCDFSNLPTVQLYTVTAPDIDIVYGTLPIKDGWTVYFDKQPLNSTTEFVLTLQNNGNYSLYISSYSMYGSEFSEFSHTVGDFIFSSISESGSTTFTIRFSPTSFGAKSAVIDINSTDPDENPYTIILRGYSSAPTDAEIDVKQGTTAIADGTGIYDFGSQPISTNTDKVFTIQNIGLTASTLGSYLITGTNADQFSLQGTNPSTVSASGSTSFTIRFAPTSLGAKTATISFANQDSDENPYNFTITGTGTTPAYTVTYNANGGTGTLTDGSSPYTSGTSVTVLANTFTRTGYTFNGWNTASDGSGTNYVATNTFNITANTTLYAKWTINTYTLTYNANGGTGTLTDGSSPYNYNTSVTVLANTFARTGYTFNGWNTASDGSGTNYVATNTFNITANTTLYAKWTIILAPEINVKEAATSIADGSGSYDFGSQITSTSTDIIFRIENIGTAVSALGSFTLSNTTDFSFVGINPTTIAASGTATFTIRFTPTSTGAKTSTISFANQDSDENPYNFTINGTGVLGNTIWIGPEPAHWTNGAPTAIVNATIDWLYDENINIVCKDLTINAGKNLEIQPSYNVTINGNLTNNGNIILKSPNSLATSGSLITLGTITNNGTMKAERYIQANKYFFMASPLNASVNAASPFMMDYVWTYLEGYSGGDNDYAWSQLTSQGSTIDPKIGYLVKSSSSFPQNSNLVIPFAGTFNTGVVNYGTLPTLNQGYNLVANPYPSAIDWNATGWTKTGIAGTTWIWKSNGVTEYSGLYATWDGTTDVNGGSRYIAPMQSFFVKATAGNTLAVNNNVRVHNTENFKSEVSDLIKLTVSGNSTNDEIALYFNEDNEDSEKFFSWNTEMPQIYSIEADKKLAINKLQDVKAQQSVNLGIVCDIAGTYTITANEFTFNNATSIVLEDLKTGTFTSLSKDKSYAFAYEVGESENRFVLHFNYVATSIDEVSEINIFANAKSIYFNNIDNQIGTVKVYNVLGQTVLTSDLKSVIETNLNTGVYVVEVVTNNNKITKQIIIN